MTSKNDTKTNKTTETKPATKTARKLQPRSAVRAGEGGSALCGSACNACCNYH